jgi:hypothetical protein
MVIKVGHAHKKKNFQEINFFCASLLKLNPAFFCTCADGFHNFCSFDVEEISHPQIWLAFVACCFC